MLRSQDFFGGIDFSYLPTWVFMSIWAVIILGMLLTLVLLVLVVYAQIRLVQVEHEGFHAIEEKEREQQYQDEEVEGSGKNDRWQRIEELAEGGSEGDWRRAILEADIMLFDVLRAQGYPGEAVGEQLKMANPIQMTTLDLAWKAHKVRNDVAHGGESLPLTERDARTTISYYKRVFEEFGEI